MDLLFAFVHRFYIEKATPCKISSAAALVLHTCEAFWDGTECRSNLHNSCSIVVVEANAALSLQLEGGAATEAWSNLKTILLFKVVFKPNDCTSLHHTCKAASGLVL